MTILCPKQKILWKVKDDSSMALKGMQCDFNPVDLAACPQ
jgi:hypothetical protein